MSTAATSRSSSARARPSMSLNSTTRVVCATSTCGPIEPRTGTTRPFSSSMAIDLVDRAVVAVVVDDDLAAAGDVAGEPEREPVGVGGRQGELPGRQAEPARELLAGPDGVLGREHVGDAAAELALDGGDRRARAVAGHRPGVAEAEVDVFVAVDAGEAGAGGLVDEQRKRAGPLDHPVHRHAVEERGLGPLVEGVGARDARSRSARSRRP